MKKTLTALALAAATFMASAAAVPGQLTAIGFEHAGAPTGTMTVNPPGLFNTQTTTFAVGAINVEFTPDAAPAGPAEQWLAFCIELFAPLANFGQTKAYTQNMDPALAPYGANFSATQQSRLDKLFVKNALEGGLTGETGGSDNAVKSAAMQLAVWEIMYDDADFGDLSAGLFGLGAGEFYSTSTGGARTAAETLITGLDSYDTTGYTVQFVSFNNGGTKEGKQDLLAGIVSGGNFGDSCDIFPDNPECQTSVPEPGSLALALTSLGLLGAGGAARRRKAA